MKSKSVSMMHTIGQIFVTILLFMCGCTTGGKSSVPSGIIIDELDQNALISDLKESEMIGVCREILNERKDLYRENTEEMCLFLAYHSSLVWEETSNDLVACEGIVNDCETSGINEVFVDDCNFDGRLTRIVNCPVTVGYLKSCLNRRSQLLIDAVESARNATCEIRAEGFSGWPIPMSDYEDEPRECEDIYLDDNCSLILQRFNKYDDD